ncbi:MAG: Stk1 family PASTA domain-containing Ser/Thr kinase [Clostridiales bacterium]|nr:Stk1 family PASTA domain-containing Ser/Thr kinase [Clostridiales bacterium]
MIENGMMIADRYEIEKKIGAGGMSDVYKAKDLTLGRCVAIKVLKAEFGTDKSFVEKFRAEAQSAAGLEHPNIVNVYDVGTQGDLHYIIMEYVQGITLKTYIEKKGQLNYKETLSIAIQVARGIQAAHARNIIHRDIKPQNIMISTDGKVKVTDFGIARAVSENTIHADVMGSVHYASPEQTRNGFVSNASDIYSLGIVMYEMVTGRVPFDGDSTVAVAIKHLQDEMIPPSEYYAPDLPISLEKIILKCTQKSADRRYASMEDLLVDLRKSLLTPNEDFVDLHSPVAGKTRVVSDDEFMPIQDGTAASQDEDEEDKNGKYGYIYEDDDEEDDDEDEGGFLNSRMEKIVKILTIVVLVIIAAVVIYMVGNFFGLIDFSKKSSNDTEITETIEQVEMIDLTGMTLAEAEEALEEIGLLVEQSGEEESEDYEAGQIIFQDVEEGDLVAEGTTIYVTVAAEPEEEEVAEVSVPNVVGYTSDSAMAALEDKGLSVVREFEYDSSVEAGKVIRQSPSAGSTAAEGDTVTIYVSQGSETTKVPNVVGKTEADARAELADASLNVGSVTQDYSDTVAEGNVISQSVSSGKYVDMGTSVDLVISLGAKETTYYINNSIKAPTNVTVAYADIELYKAESDELIGSWTNITTFPYTISVTGITGTSQGTLVIVWYYYDESGNVVASNPQEETVSFHEE